MGLSVGRRTSVSRARDLSCAPRAYLQMRTREQHLPSIGSAPKWHMIGCDDCIQFATFASITSCLRKRVMQTLRATARLHAPRHPLSADACKDDNCASMCSRAQGGSACDEKSQYNVVCGMWCHSSRCSGSSSRCSCLRRRARAENETHGALRRSRGNALACTHRALQVGQKARGRRGFACCPGDVRNVEIN